MKVFVTGGAGFIGSHLTRRLIKEGHDVLVLDELHPYYSIERKKRHGLAKTIEWAKKHEAEIR